MPSPTSGQKLRVTQPPSAFLTSHRCALLKLVRRVTSRVIPKNIQNDEVCLFTWRLQSELGDIVYVELPEVGSEVTKGENFGVVESVKVGDTVQCIRAVLSYFSVLDPK